MSDPRPLIRYPKIGFDNFPGAPHLAQRLRIALDQALEVLRCVAEGSGDRHIAKKLLISEETVKVHIRHIMVKLGETFGILFQMGAISAISLLRSLAVFFVTGRNPRPVRRGAQ